MARWRAACRVAALTGVLLPGAAAAQVEAAPGTTVIVVRHAEKASGPTSDPPLAPEGRLRAHTLAGLAEAAGVTAVYATPYRRTVDTGRPTADRLGVPLETVPVGEGGIAAHARALAERIRDAHGGEAVLVVGHSNTVPAIVEALTGVSIPDLDEEEYDRVFVVVFGPEGPRLIPTRY